MGTSVDDGFLFNGPFLTITLVLSLPARNVMWRYLLRIRVPPSAHGGLTTPLIRTKTQKLAKQPACTKRWSLHKIVGACGATDQTEPTKNEGGYPSRSFFPREKQTERATGVGWTVNVKQQGDYTRQFFCVFLFPSPNAASGGGRLTKRCLVCYCQKEHSLPLKNPILLVITWRTEKSLKQVRESANSKDVRPKKTLRT